MPLNKLSLKESILAALERQAAKVSEGDEPSASREQLATDISNAIEAFVKSGTVNTTVTGTAVAGVVNGTGQGGIT